MRMFVGVVAAAIFLSSASRVIAADFDSVTPTKEASEAARNLAPLINVESWFKGPGNLFGVAARSNGNPLIFFIDPDGRNMVSGVVIDLKTKRNILQDASVHFFPSEAAKSNTSSPLPTPSKSSADTKLLGRLFGISQGQAKSGKVAYIIIDFGCDHCMSLYSMLAKEKFSGEIRWVPVTFSGEIATTKAALALGSGKMEPAMSLSGNDLVKAIKEKKEFLVKGAMSSEANTKLVSSLNVTLTPYFFYEKNGVVMEHAGYSGVSGLIDQLGVR